MQGGSQAPLLLAFLGVRKTPGTPTYAALPVNVTAENSEA